MEITNVRISLKDEERLKAFATIYFDDCFVVRNLRVISGKNRLFVAMPSKKRKDGTHQDIAHPITKEMRDKIEAAVLAKYNEVLENPEKAVQQEEPSISPEEGINQDEIV